MAIIRLSTEEVFDTDSQEYEILTNAVMQIKGVDGAVVEIGTRRGGSAKMIIDTLVSNNDTNRSMFCIDPYGNIEIECTNLNMAVHYPGTHIEGDPQSKEITSPHRFDYTNEMRNRVIPSLYYYAYQAGVNFTFFCLEDYEFFNRYSDGVPVYNHHKKIENKYAFVFFDGPHDNTAVLMETQFFVTRAVIGTVFVMDDVWMYDHDMVEKYLFDNGFEILEKKNIKASYRKVR
jgi:cephalosporin hydroxylase